MPKRCEEFYTSDLHDTRCQACARLAQEDVMPLTEATVAELRGRALALADVTQELRTSLEAGNNAALTLHMIEAWIRQETGIIEAKVTKLLAEAKQADAALQSGRERMKV